MKTGRGLIKTIIPFLSFILLELDEMFLVTKITQTISQLFSDDISWEGKMF